MGWNLRALGIRLAIGSPEVKIDTYWLGRQQELLGQVTFERCLREHLGDDGVAAVLATLVQAQGASG